VNLPGPQVGSVIRFSFLWRHEADQGREEGAKDRPAAIIASFIHDKTGKRKVLVLPITRTPPRDPSVAVEIPARTRRALGLGPEPCWVICSETNRFTWPGHDIRQAPNARGREWIYGMLPRGLFLEIAQRFAQIARRGRTKIVDRD
jgi:mRNA-degrading endonuclease toxin of MazEF toxin-antitoxin module